MKKINKKKADEVGIGLGTSLKIMHIQQCEGGGGGTAVPAWHQITYLNLDINTL